MAEAQADGYRDVRVRATALLRELDPRLLDQPAPATPEWRVRDVLAHVVGVANDVVEGRIDGVASDPWTAAQVERRAGATVAEMLDEWDAFGPQFEAVLARAPEPISSQAVFDAVTHEHDIRHALGLPGGRACDAIDVAFWFYRWGREQNSAPALRIVTERGEHVAGTGEVVAAVSTSAFEILRAGSGRRSAEEIAAYEWDRAVDPSIVLFADIFTMRATPLGE